MAIQSISTQVYEGQRPGISGLRKTVNTFIQALYLDNFVQSLLNVLNASSPDGNGLRGKTLVLGGDGRYYNLTAVQTILKIAAANGVARVLIGRGGILSTPAASAVIRRHGAFGGIILSASNNLAGVNGDFGIKYYIGNGGPAPESLTEAVYQQTLCIKKVQRSDVKEIDIYTMGVQQVEQMKVEVIDPVSDYLDVLRDVFDFDALRKLFARDFRIVVDGMNAVGGIYAKAILEKELGAPPGSVINAELLPDFGGLLPDPNPVHAAELVRLMTGALAPDFGAAMGGDADRNMIVGQGMVVSPSDSLAIMTAHARLIPAYRDGLVGVARSMPTSTAVDRVAKVLNIPCYETPTGWKYFGNLLDSQRVTLCGEESYGTGSNHLPEKDGLWAILFWLNMLAVTEKTVSTLVSEHWKTYGRTYYTRHDYEDLSESVAHDLMDGLRYFMHHLMGKTFGSRTLILADDFSYTDPVDGSVSSAQGIRFVFDDGARVIFRLSGTTTAGTTLRLYLERCETNALRHNLPLFLAMAELVAWANAVAGIRQRTGRKMPSLST